MEWMMGKKSEERKMRKMKERKKRKELARQKESLDYNFTREHKKQGVRNIAILIGLSILSAGLIVYFFGNL